MAAKQLCKLRIPGLTAQPPQGFQYGQIRLTGPVMLDALAAADPGAGDWGLGVRGWVKALNLER
jgi:hypothetical protein